MQKFIEKVYDIQKTITFVSLDSEFYSQLTKGFTKFDSDGNCVARYSFGGRADELYKCIDELLSKIIGCAKCYALCVYLQKNVISERLNVIAIATEAFKNIEVKQ